MGAGIALAQRGQVLLRLKPGVCPHFPFLNNPTSQISS